MLRQRASALFRPLLASPAGAALAVRDFRMLWLANAGGSFAINFWFISTAWLVFELTDSQLWVGIVGGSAAISGILLTPVGGAVTDRSDRRKILGVSMLLFASLAVATGILDATSRISAVHLLVLALLIGAVDAFSNPAYRTMVVDLVGDSRLLGANALGQIGEFAGEVVAPLVVGVLITLRGPGAAYFVAAGVLLCAALAMMFVRGTAVSQTRRNPDASTSSGMLDEIREGIQHAVRTPSVMPLLVISAASIFGAMVFPLLPVYARDVLRVGPTGFGVLSAAIAAGMGTGAMAMAVSKRIPQGGWAILIAHMLVYGSMAGFAVSRVFVVSVALLFTLGVGTAIASNLVMTAVQTRVDDHVRGRIMSIFRVTESFELFGLLLGGGLAMVVGNSSALLIGGTVGAALATLVFIRSRALRTL